MGHNAEFRFKASPTTYSFIQSDMERFGQPLQVFLERVLRRFYFNVSAAQRRGLMAKHAKSYSRRSERKSYTWCGSVGLVAQVRQEIDMIQRQHRAEIGPKGFIAIVMGEFYMAQPESERCRIMTSDKATTRA